MSASGSASNFVPVSNPQEYQLDAYSSPIKIDLRQIELLLPLGEVERFDQHCLVHHKDNERKIFIFRFGTVVFFNIPRHNHEAYLSRIEFTPSQANKLNQDEIAEDQFTLRVEKGTTKIGFNNVTISELNLPNLQLVAQVLGQSSALEIIEWEVEEFLAESDRLTRTLRRGAQIRKKRDQLMEFIGQGLNARHRIINQISLLSQPDTTWETEELYVLYNNLFKNFDMEDRVERIEKMLELSSDVSKLLLEILNARRAEFLEIVIILLIVAELLVPLWGSLKTLL